MHFNPRPPRGERLRFNFRWSMLAKFQSTPSARRATTWPRRWSWSGRDFNPRPPRGERPGILCRMERTARISIHALREESDPAVAAGGQHGRQFQSTPSARRATQTGRPATRPGQFQSTPSARRATVRQRVLPFPCWISIHALREESDFTISKH